VAQYLASLNDEQQQVAVASTGPYVVAGAPGSGKTRAIIARIARLVCDGLAPQYILAMTFTVKAAEEMERRLLSLGIHGVEVGTIHRICRRILVEETDFVSRYKVDERSRLGIELKRQIGDYRKSRKFHNQIGVDREGIEKYVSACKARGICYIDGDPFGTNFYSSDHLKEEGQHWQHDAGVAPSVLFQFYNDYERRRAGCGLMSFDDMLLWAWSLFVADPTSLENWRRKWSVVIVDEAQDSNPIQWDLACMLVGYKSWIRSAQDLPTPPTEDTSRDWSVMMAGDASQSIYGFRHADPNAYVEMANRSEVTLLTLPKNYRSTPEICHVGTELVKEYPWHFVGTIEPAYPTPAPGSIQLHVAPSPEEEVATAVQSCMEHAEDGGLKSCVILGRMSASLHLAEIECIRKRIRYIKAAPGSFLEATSIQTVLNYLRVASDYDPSGECLRAIINRPYRRIGNNWIDRCSAIARASQMSLLDVMMNEVKGRSFLQRRAVGNLYETLVDLNEIACEVEPGDSPPARMITMMLDRTDYLAELRREEGLHTQDESKEILLAELHRIAEMFKSVAEFLGYIDALHVAVKRAAKDGLRVKEGTDALTLSTIHRAKGLEWDHVKVIDVTKGRFPHARSRSLEEELRLLYVAITRARKTCVVSHVATEEPSSFVEDLHKILKEMDHAD
jgi:DNA helicase-2/ATP-dependent DNA helicase PcrA